MGKYLVIAAVLQIIWGIVPTASKLVINEIPVELFVTLRWSISGIIFLLYLFISKSWRKISFKQGIKISVLGILGYGLASIGTLYGLKYGGVVNFALVGSVGPVITSLTCIWLLKEKAAPWFCLALTFCVSGLVLLVVGKYEISSMTVAGLSAGLIIGSSFLEALVLINSKKLKGEVNVPQYLAIAQLAAAAWMWFLQLVLFHQTSSLLNLSLTGIMAGVFVSIVACVLCYAVLYWLLGFIDGHRLALFDGFHTLSATLFGLYLLNEPLRPLMIIGGVLVLAGLVVGNIRKPCNNEDFQ